MKNNAIKNVALTLAVLMTASVGGCGQSDGTLKYTVSETYEYEEPATFYIDILGEDVMPIMGYWGPYKDTYYNGSYLPSLQTPEMYADVKESGVNLIIQGNDNYRSAPDKVKNILQMCEDAGLGYLIVDSSLWSIGGDKNTDRSTWNEDQSAWNERVAEWNEYKSFAGIDLEDEPHTPSFSSIGQVAEMFKNACTANEITSKYAYVNAFPKGYLQGREGIPYTTHLDEWCTKGNPDILCYDLYPFKYDAKDNFTASAFFNNLADIYNKSKEYNVPFASFVQVGGNWTDEGDFSGVCPPTMEQLLWEVNVFLTYGAKAIYYFTLCMPHSFYKYLQYDGQTGFFDPWGNRTEWFYAGKMANEQIAATDHILMHTNHHGVIKVGDLPGDGRITGFLSENKFRQLQSVNEDCTALIGCMDYKGKTTLYVMNSSYYEKTEVTLSFDGNYCYDVIQRAQSASVIGKTLTLKLDPGEAALVTLR